MNRHMLSFFDHSMIPESAFWPHLITTNAASRDSFRLSLTPWHKKQIGIIILAPTSARAGDMLT